MPKIRMLTSVAVAVAVFLLVGIVWAGSSASYAINWQVLNSGGAPSMGGNVSLNGSLSQTAIGPAASTGYSLGSGYWFTGMGGVTLYLPVVLKNEAVMPNLVIDSLTASSTTVQVVIRNAGTDPVYNDFWVDVSFDPTVRPPRINQPWNTIAAHGVTWGVRMDEAVLDPGDTLKLVNDASDPFYYGPPMSSAPPLPVGAAVYAYVDSVDYATTWGAVRESNENDNTAGPVISGTSDLSPDSFPQQTGEVVTGNVPPR